MSVSTTPTRTGGRFRWFADRPVGVKIGVVVGLLAVVMIAKRNSLISSCFAREEGIFCCVRPSKELRLGLPFAGVNSSFPLPPLRGRHLLTASTLARQGWTCSGYENMTNTTIAARPMVEATEGVYCATIFPRILSPKER